MFDNAQIAHKDGTIDGTAAAEYLKASIGQGVRVAIDAAKETFTKKDGSTGTNRKIVGISA